MRDGSLALFVVIVLAALVELAVRAYETLAQVELGAGSPLISDPETGFALRPLYEGRAWETFVRLDPRGFRNDPYRGPDPKRRTILNLGDSTTFGVSVSEGKTYGRVLQERLDREYPGQFDVINAGVPGYSTREVRQLVERKRLLERIRPEIVTLYIGWNDHWIARPERSRGSDPRTLGSLRRIKARVVSILHTLRWIDAWRVEAMRFIQGLRQKPARRLEARELLDDAQRGVLPDPGAHPLNVPPEAFVANLNAILDLGQAVDCHWILMVQPTGADRILLGFVERFPLVSPTPLFFHPRYQELTRQIGMDRGVPTADLQERFESAGDVASLFSDPIHPNEKGHEVIAAELFRIIRELEE